MSRLIGYARVSTTDQEAGLGADPFLVVDSTSPDATAALLAEIEKMRRERDEAKAYLKAFVYATIDPEDTRADVQVHQANPSLGWIFTLNDTGLRKVRSILGSQIRRAMEIVGFDKLKVEAPETTVADDHIAAARRVSTLLAEIEGLRGAGWQDISTHRAEAIKGPYSPHVICAHAEKQWQRFGRYDLTLKRWYYSGTNERSQWAQVEGDEPTHWMPMPEPPARATKDRPDV